MTATGIPTADLYAAWPGLWPLIEPAYQISDDKTDILAGLRTRELQLWAVASNNAYVAGIVTKLLLCGDKQPSEKHCHLWLVGGAHLSDWSADFIAKLKPWAKAEGCTWITGNGRAGWARIVRRFGGVRLPDHDGLACWGLKL